MNKKLQTKSELQVLEELTGDGMDDEAKAKLKFEYKKFYEMYSKLVMDALTKISGETQNQNKKYGDYQNIIDEILNLDRNPRRWVEEDVKQLPKLLALIFALWTLMTSDSYKTKAESENFAMTEAEQREMMKDYLLQPHPAQVFGIMRIMGIGYNPKQIEVSKE